MKKSPLSAEISLRKRYLFKLTTNLFEMAVGMGTQSIVPRALGPAAYGDFSFLTSFFWRVIGFLNFNSSSAFYTKLSQRQNEVGLVGFYLYVLIAIGFVIALITGIFYSTGINRFVLPGQAGLFVVFGAFWAFLMFCAMVLGEMTDAYGLTVKAEMLKMGMKIVGLALVIIMFWRQWFSLRNFFLYHFFILIVTIWLLTRTIFNSSITFDGFWRLRKAQTSAYLLEFSGFCLPLVVFSTFSVLEGILDRWFIQKFSGSVEQGFYGLAYQIGAICFLFASAMVPLVAREYAISYITRDVREMGRVFSRSAPMLYSIVAYFGCFLAVESKNVMLMFGGQAYSGAILPIAIMCFFPIHQTYGQLNGSIFFATNRTTVYSNIGIALFFVGLPLTFFLLGPKSYGALQSGATGLAIKMVVLQIASVNIQLWYNTQMMKLPFAKFFVHQVVIILVFVCAAFMSSYMVSSILGHVHFMLQFIISGLIYTTAIFGVAVSFPSTFSLRQEEISKILGIFRGKSDLKP
ncbi:MAG: hypothetical protein WAV13_05625 [Thermodesulfovibrionales bacterium]